jgi:hypothetical protein
VPEAEAKNQELAVVNHVNKTDFTLAKLKQYLKDVQRGEAVLAKNGGSDPSLRHRPVGGLLKEMRGVQEAAEPLAGQLEGFLSLQPSPAQPSPAQPSPAQPSPAWSSPPWRWPPGGTPSATWS